jgi:GNAT superfamily N-acetyltransferase
MLGFLTEVDHRDHEALLALDAVRGELVGVARFVRLESDPTSAEVAVTVVDDWQGQGLGTALLDALAERAREEGVTRFTGVALAQNRDVLGLLGKLGAVRVVGRGPGTVELAVDLHLSTSTQTVATPGSRSVDGETRTRTGDTTIFSRSLPRRGGSTPRYRQL